MAAGDRTPERAALADEVLLADELAEAARAHAGRERLPLGWRLEERLGSGAAGSGTGGRHKAMVAPRAAAPAVVRAPANGERAT